MNKYFIMAPFNYYIRNIEFYSRENMLFCFVDFFRSPRSIITSNRDL